MDVNYRGSIKFTINKTNQTQNLTAKIKAKKSDEQCQITFVIHVCESFHSDSSCKASSSHKENHVVYNFYRLHCYLFGKKVVLKIIELLPYS